MPACLGGKHNKKYSKGFSKCMGIKSWMPNNFLIKGFSDQIARAQICFEARNYTLIFFFQMPLNFPANCDPALKTKVCKHEILYCSFLSGAIFLKPINSFTLYL